MADLFLAILHKTVFRIKQSKILQ